MNALAENYAARGRKYLAQASEELARDDLEQASEKGWGAASQMLKAVAAERGWPHGAHRHFYEIADRLADETGDEEIRVQVGLARNLHTNFYEGEMTASTIQFNLTRVTQLVERVETILANGAAS